MTIKKKFKIDKFKIRRKNDDSNGYCRWGWFSWFEAAYQLAQRGIKVNLIEMRPVKQTPAHHTDKFAELVCSNSLRGNSLTNAVGVLKEEMRRLDSLIIQAADKARVPAGGALAVDRHDFAGYITDTLRNHPNVTVLNEEVNSIPEGYTIIATGPLTTEHLAQEIVDITGKDQLYFMMLLLNC